jgi:excisionase family DNA binding protein
MTPSVSLDAIAADPTLVGSLRPKDAAKLILRASAALAALATVSPAPCPAPAPGDDRWLGVAELATRLGFAESYVYELLRCGQLPGRRIGKYWRVRRSALLAWEAGGGQPNVSPSRGVHGRGFARAIK